MEDYPLLNQIQYPADLRKVERAQLPQVCHELRQFIIDHVSVHGGHFGASLGVVELTVALHYAFNTPDDLLVWDVGHQAYGHKILTGRRDVFHTNRTAGGISGFPKRAESEYDTFGVGHSSTSISAALGMAVASRYLNVNRQHVAVIGDGALTGGMAFEALNNAGVSNTNLLVILNDNCMSIDPNVGALKDYLTQITTSKVYNKLKEDVWNALGKLSSLGKRSQEIVSKIETGLKSTLLSSSNLFESLNLRYFGPVDGHDVQHLADVLRDLKDIPGPKILHCLTVKGKGYEPAEKGNATTWHSPGLFDKVTGKIFEKKSTSPTPRKYQDVFGQTLIELAKKNPKVVAVTPAMPSGSSLVEMMKEMPERVFDVGIAEQHAVTFSAGLATQGLTAYCAIYSSFLQRGYDQVVHDVCIQNLPVNFAIDRAGLVGSDGATHQGTFDFAYLRCLPNIIVAAPMNETELQNLLFTAQLPRTDTAFAIRYPRGAGVQTEWNFDFDKIEIGKGRMVSDGEEVAILSVGHPGNFVQAAIKKVEADGIRPAHFDMRFVKPLDEALLKHIAQRFSTIITVEDGCLAGGFGSAVLEFYAEQNLFPKIIRLGVPDKFIEHAEQHQQHQECGFDAESIRQTVLKLSVTKPSLEKISS